jgi:hypothetical protein
MVITVKNKNPYCRVFGKKHAAYHFDKLSPFGVLHTMKTEGKHKIYVFIFVKLLFFSF